MRTAELRRLAELNKNKLIRIYNPDVEDFTCTYHRAPITIRSMEIMALNIAVANHIKKHLADHLLHKRGIKNNAEEDLRDIFKEIEVVYD